MVMRTVVKLKGDGRLVLSRSFVCCLALAGALTGCQDARVERLERRVTALEEKSRADIAADEERRHSLEQCVRVDAENAYWDYVRLNAKKAAGDTWSGPQYMWESARKQRLDKIEECKLLYAR
jgi:hypothetical protein